MDNYKILKNKIDTFVDKYYRNLFIKGILLFLLLTFSIILLLSSIEFYSNLGTNERLFLFYATVVSFIFIFYYYLLVPLLRFFHIFKRISDRATAELLQNRIPELKDYLTNVLELNSLNSQDIDLLNASISQKADYILNIDFSSALSFKAIKPLLRYLFILAVIYTVIFIFTPEIITKATPRLIHYNVEYADSPDFFIEVDPESLTVEKGKDLVVNITVSGKYLPDILKLYIGNSVFLMTKISNTNFSCTVKNVNSSFKFRVGNDNFLSSFYSVSVLQSPFFSEFSIYADFPDYTSIENKTFKNISDLKVPCGTILTYSFDVEYSDSLFFITDSKILNFKDSSDKFVLSVRCDSSFSYSVSAVNSNFRKNFVSNANVTVIPDLYPQISVIQKDDELNFNNKYFKGIISDDYGFTSLYFVCGDSSISLPINRNLISQEFYFAYEFNTPKGSVTDYYFMVYDNDKVNGFKSAMTSRFSFKSPDLQDILSEKDELNKSIYEKLEKTQMLADEYKRDIDEIRKKLFDSQLSDFERSQLFNQLEEKQNSLKDLINEINSINEDKNNKLNSFSQPDPELLKKQEQIDELMKSVMDEELKRLLDEFNKLSEELSKEELNKALNSMELDTDELSKQLDRNLELLKKYELERDLGLQADKLQELSNIIKDSLEAGNLSDSLLQNLLNTAETLKKSFEESIKLDSSLNSPYKLKDLSEEFQEISDLLDDASKSKNIDNDSSSEDSQNSKDENSAKDKNDNSEDSLSEKLEDASKKSEKLSKKINSLVNNNSLSQNAENADVLRQILENLIYFSFEQEDILVKSQITSSLNPNYSDLIKRQQKLTYAFTIIKDSLYALSKRTPSIGAHINKQVFDIYSSLLEIEDLYDNNKKNRINFLQHKNLENSNELILLLSESLKNMDNASGSGSGQQQKSKRKQKPKPSLGDMQKSQENMKSQLEKMINSMKDSKNGKQGQKSGNSQQLAKMLAQQEIFQNQLNSMLNSGGLGKDTEKLLNEINKMIEQNKRDIINQQIDKQTLFRQQRILTKLLDADNAEQKRDIDKKREAEEALQYKLSEPKEIFDNDKEIKDFNDVLNKNNLHLKYYYNLKYNDYIDLLNK